VAHDTSSTLVGAIKAITKPLEGLPLNTTPR